MFLPLKALRDNPKRTPVRRCLENPPKSQELLKEDQIESTSAAELLIKI